jgi:hypothetical protein
LEERPQVYLDDFNKLISTTVPVEYRLLEKKAGIINKLDKAITSYKLYDQLPVLGVKLKHNEQTKAVVYSVAPDMSLGTLYYLEQM